MLFLQERILSLNVLFNKDIEMLKSLCLKASFAKTKPYSRIQQLSQFSRKKRFYCIYHENLRLEVVLRVRKCTHMAVSLDIQTSRLQRGDVRREGGVRRRLRQLSVTGQLLCGNASGCDEGRR